MSPGRTDQPGPLAGVRVALAVKAADGWLYVAPAGTAAGEAGWTALGMLSRPWADLSRFGAWNAELPGEIVTAILGRSSYAALVQQFTAAASALAAPAARTGEHVCNVAHPDLPSAFVTCTAARGHEPAWHALHGRAGGEPRVIWAPL